MSQLLNHYFNNVYFVLYMRHFCIFHTLLTIGHHGNLRKRNKRTRERPPCYLTLLLFVWWLFLKSCNMWNTYLAKSVYILSLPIRNWISHLFLFWEYITFFFLSRHVKIRKWRDQKSVQRIWVGRWGWRGHPVDSQKSLIWWMFNYSSLLSLLYSGHFEHWAYLIWETHWLFQKTRRNLFNKLQSHAT